MFLLLKLVSVDLWGVNFHTSLPIMTLNSF